MIILSGCNSELLTSASNNEDEIIEYDLSNYPIAVRNGDVSPEYYDGVMGIVNRFVDLLDYLRNNLQDYDGVKNAGNNYLAELTTYDLSPTTEVDYDLDEYLTKYIIRTKMSAEYYIKYATEKDKLYLDMANDYKNDALASGNTMVAIGNKYGLNEF